MRHVLTVLLACAALAGAAVPACAQSATSGTATPEASTTPSLPSAPAAIGRLRRDKDGNIVRAKPRTPDAGDDAGLGLDHPAISPPSRAELPPSSDPIPGFGNRPDVTTPVFDPRRVSALQDTQEQERRARRHQADVDRILREEADAKRNGAPVDSRGLTAREIALEQALNRIDREVKEHEMAHYRTAQPHAALPEYWSVVGPLGKRYVVTGITRFDVSETGESREAAIRKYQTLYRAALAPRTPSEVDRRVADELTRLIALLRSRK